MIWFIAGVNVAAIGLQAFLGFNGALLFGLILAAIAVFIVFFRMFRKMVDKHSRRILSYENRRMNVLRFFDTRGYLIMAAMMTFGFGARALGVFPDWFLAFFYTGLGCALATSGILFCRQFIGVHILAHQSS